MITGNELKQYFWRLFGILGVVLFWAGLWDGVGSLPYLSNPLFSLVVCIVLFTLSGVIFKETSPLWSPLTGVNKVLKEVHNHPAKHEFQVKYEDQLKKKDFLVGAQWLKKIEKDFLAFHDQQRKEVFIPINRIKEVLSQGKSHWMR